jgi:hypothetical protein
MSNISSNCLFHFTPKKEHLINILEENFIPRYSFENVRLSNLRDDEIFESGIPMVCFCDISLSQINNHIKTYGNYGIGMTKEWGIKNKLNPIIYINPDSYIAGTISKLAESVNNALCENLNETSKSICDEYMNTLNFLKPYDGDFKRGRKTFKNVRFYDEREWRFVPKISIASEYESTISKKEFNNPEVLQQANNKMVDFRLKFEPKDIKYIFLKNENEIHQMVEKLRNIKQGFSSKEIDILTSKILTTQQIEEDF